jgi:hypothetical protein
MQLYFIDRQAEAATLFTSGPIRQPASIISKTHIQILVSCRLPYIDIREHIEASDLS